MSFDPLQIVIIAGEESGDQHAAKLIKQLLQINPQLIISGIGGQHMRNAGAEIINNLAYHSVTGFTAVIRNIKVIYTAMRQIKEHLLQRKPQVLILVDYPGFNLRLAKFAKQKLNLKIIYYISPQIWAWKMQRIKIIQKYIDHMAVILPFEKDLYQKNHVPVSFVGHPLLDMTTTEHDIAVLKQQFKLPLDKKIIALLPGSRNNEIKYHMPVFIETIIKLNTLYADLYFIIPVAKTIDIERIRKYLPDNCKNISLFTHDAVPLVACSDCVIVASGTAALECALLAKPMCIVYKASVLTAVIAAQVIRVKYFGLCNLLSNKMIVPELLQYDCNPKELQYVIHQLLYDTTYTNQMVSNLQILKKKLSSEQADVRLSDLVMHII